VQTIPAHLSLSSFLLSILILASLWTRIGIFVLLSGEDTRQSSDCARFLQQVSLKPRCQILMPSLGVFFLFSYGYKTTQMSLLMLTLQHRTLVLSTWINGILLMIETLQAIHCLRKGDKGLSIKLLVLGCYLIDVACSAFDILFLTGGIGTTVEPKIGPWRSSRLSQAW
jgi:hypothetical protein